MGFDFDRNTVLITGARSGIGRPTVLAFAQAGAKVVLATRDEDEGMETLALIGGEKAGKLIKTDVSRLNDMQKASHTVVEIYRRRDIASNNAGVQPNMAPLAEITPEDWERVFSIDLIGLCDSIKAELPVIIGQGGGFVGNMASTSGIRSAPSQDGYSAAKHGRSAALEYAKAGFRVTAVLPGSVATPPVQQAIADDPELGKMIEEMVPLGRSARPEEEVADAVLLLASDNSNFIVVHSLVVDGGMTIK